jgi:aromatic ring hydroxylase
MAIRTGKQFLEALRDDRQIWIDGERVKDVTTDRRFAGAAQSMAELYEMQHDPALQAQLTYARRHRASASACRSFNPRRATTL